MANLSEATWDVGVWVTEAGTAKTMLLISVSSPGPNQSLPLPHLHGTLWQPLPAGGPALPQPGCIARLLQDQLEADPESSVAALHTPGGPETFSISGDHREPYLRVSWQASSLDLAREYPVSNGFFILMGLPHSPVLSPLRLLEDWGP